MRLPSNPPCGGDQGEHAPGSRRRPPATREQEDDRNEPRRLHRQVQRCDSPEGGRVLPAPLPPLGERRHPAPAAPHAPGGAGRRHKGRGPLAPGQPGHDRRRRDGNGKNLHRCGGGAHGGLREDPGPLPAAPDEEMEAGGGGDRPVRTGRHRHLDHRAGEAPAFHRLGAVVRRDEQGAGEALLPLEGRRHLPMGDVAGQAHQGGGDGGAVSSPLLPGLHGPGRGQGRGAADGRRPEPQKAHLRRLWLAPLAGRQLRPQALPAQRLREAQDEGLLRPADRRRDPRVQGSWLGPGHRRRGPRRRLRQIPQPERDPHGRVRFHALPSALPVLTGDQDGIRTFRGVPLDQAVRL